MTERDKDKQWGIIYCPRGGVRHTQKRWRKIERALKDNDVRYDFIQCENAAGVTRLVGMLIDNGYKTIVIAGGDTALNDAVNRLMEAEKDVRDSIAVGVIPCGLMNDYAHYWGISADDMGQTVAMLRQRRTRKVDVGCVEYTPEGENTVRRRQYFVNCLNVGLAATIMNLRRQTRRALLGSRTLSLLASMVLMIFQRLDYKINVRINATDIRHSNVMTMCIGKALGYGQTPSAVPYNGWLDVSMVLNTKLTQLMAGFYLFLHGRVLNHRSVRAFRTSRVDVAEARHAMVSVDGRLLEPHAGPFTVTVMQEEINFIIPA